MVKLRLQRQGRKNRPYYRIIAIADYRKRQGQALDILGQYDPVNKTFSVDREQYKSWIEKGAQPSERVKKLVEDGISGYTEEIRET